MSTHYNNVANAVSGTPGTGTITLGAAITGAQSLATAAGGNATVDVFITDGNAWEVARNCTYTHSGTTLTRGTLEASSTGAVLSLTSAAVVRVAMPASTGNALELQLDRGLAVVGNSAGNTQSFGAISSTKIAAALNTVSQNSRGWWKTGTARYEPTEAGNYSCGVFYTLSAMGANKLLQGQIWKNGAVFARGDAIDSGASAAAIIAASASWVVPMNGTTDYIEFYGYNGDSSARNSDSAVGRVGVFAYRL